MSLRAKISIRLKLQVIFRPITYPEGKKYPVGLSYPPALHLSANHLCLVSSWPTHPLLNLTGLLSTTHRRLSKPQTGFFLTLASLLRSDYISHFQGKA